MGTIKPEDVQHIAELSRLLLTPEETKKFSGQLSSILDYMTKLNAVETQNVEPTNQVTDQVNQSRPDGVEAQSKAVRDALLKAAPKTEADGFVVPTVLKE